MNPTERALKALYSGDSQKTPEVVEALDEIVKNAGYSSHDSSGQLNLLFLKMLDRLFGEDVTTVGNPETVISAVYGSWSKSVLGGWLRAFISSQLDAASLIGSVPSIVRRSNAGVYEPPSLKLLKFLFPYSPFLGLLENTRVEYQWSLDLLPSKVKLLLSSKAATGVVDSVAAALFAKMIGNDVVTIGLEKTGQAPHRSLQVGSFRYLLLCLVRYPTLSNHYLSKNIPPAFSGIRNSEPTTSNLDILHAKGCAAWLESIPYLKLLSVYIEDLVLSTEESRSSRLPHHVFFFLLMVEFWFDQANILHHDFAFASEYRNIIFQGDQTTRKPQSSGLLANSGSDKDNNKFMSNAMIVDSVRHPHPTEPMMLDHVFPRFTASSLQSAYTLLWMMMKQLGNQPHLLLAYSQSLDDMLPERHTRSNYRRRNNDAANNVELRTVLDQLLLLQMPLFDMLSAIFARQQQLDKEVILMAVEVWLLYTLPWKTLPTFFTGVTSPEEAHIYRRMYIAFNLPFYSTLFVLFFKMMSRMNLTNSLDGHRNLNILTRVLDMFLDDTNIMQIVNTFSVNFTGWYGTKLAAQKQQPQFGNPRTPQKTRSVSTQEVSGDELWLMKDTHGRLFPDSGITSLEDFGITDFQKYALDSARIVISSTGLIETNESMLPTAMADAIDVVATKLTNYVYDLFGLEAEDTASSTSSNSRIQSIKRRIMQLLPDLQTISTSGSGSAVQTTIDSSATTNIRDYGTGKLTEEGRELVQKRMIRFNAAEIDSTLCDDSLNLPVCSYEWYPLCVLMIQISKTLNNELKLPKDRRWSRCSWAKILQLETEESSIGLIMNCFRFDLRFISTYRFFSSAIIVVCYLLMKWRMLAVHWGGLMIAACLYLVFQGSFPSYTIS